jgi:hypothetical protein
MVALGQPILANLPDTEAADQGFNQRLLETARRLGMGNNRRSIFRQLDRRRVQTLKFCHLSRWRGDED